MHAQKYVRKGLRPAMNHLDCKHWFPRQSQRGGPCQHNGDTRTTRRVHKRTRRSHCLNGLLITSLLKSTSYNLSQRKQRVDNGCSIDAPLPVFVRQRKQFAPSGGRNACAGRVWRALTRGGRENCFRAADFTRPFILLDLLTNRKSHCCFNLSLFSNPREEG